MRMIVTSPDGMGDAVLRQPLVAALCAAGHEVLVVCRRHATGIFRRMGEKEGAAVRVVEVAENPYAMMRLPESNRAEFGAEMVEALKGFDAELLVYGPFQWTVLEDFVREALAGVPCVRMSGHRFNQAPRAEDAEDGAKVVAVEEASHEVVKNAALCEAILGRDVTLGEPMLEVMAEDRVSAAGFLREAGPAWEASAAAGNLWVGCMGNAGDYYGEVKAWGSERWAAVLRHLVAEKGRRVVLAGDEAERASLEKLREMSGVDEGVRVVTGGAEGLSRLIGLLALAEGYVGRDTGPMHVAGALGRPVVGVFGSGLRERFLPMGRGASITLGAEVACAGCGWVCRYRESHCVKGVPVESVIAAVDAVMAGVATGREVRWMETPVERQMMMAREDAERASAARIAQLQRDVAAMTAAAVERERAFARREEAWAAEIQATVMRREEALAELQRVRDQLAGAGMREVQAQRAWGVAGAEAAVFASTAATGGGNVEGQLAMLTAQRDVAEARLRELTLARSRRLLLKLRLVSRCHWELAGDGN